MGNASRIGKAAEHLIAAAVVLSTDGELNVSTSLVDDEGVDLVFHRRGGSETLAVQVKTRTTDTKNYSRGIVQADVRRATFEARPDLAVLVAMIDKPTARLEVAWLVPSEQYAEVANVISGTHLRLRASLKAGSADKWSSYRLDPASLGKRILARLDEVQAM